MRIEEIITNIRLDHQLGNIPVVLTEPGINTFYDLQQEFNPAAVIDMVHHHRTDDLMAALIQQIDFSSDAEQIIIVDETARSGYSVKEALYSLAVTKGYTTDYGGAETMVELPINTQFIFLTNTAISGVSAMDHPLSRTALSTIYEDEAEPIS